MEPQFPQSAPPIPFHLLPWHTVRAMTAESIKAPLPMVAR